MIRRCLRLFLLVAAVACVQEPDLSYPSSPPPPPPPPPPPTGPPPGSSARLGDIVIANLPSPHYRFEYDSSGRMTAASFASDLRTYDIQYLGNVLAGMQSTGLPRDRLAYFYDGAGRATRVTYTDATGAIFVRVHLAYAGDRLVRLERERVIEGRFQLEKQLSFVYDQAGNLAELTNQRLPVGGQTAATVVDRFERYDAGINVDGFSLIHTESADHLILLPGVRFQSGNPAGVARSGSGLNYQIDYTYTYDSEHRPLTKHGEVLILNGASAGQRFQTNAAFSYR